MGTDETPERKSLLSVVIPAFNRAAVVGRAIESALAQDYRPFEILVVDDGSTDESRAVVEAYGDPVRYIWQENAERAAARNHGLRESSGDLVAFLDSDDEWLEGHLMKLVAALHTRPDVGLAYDQAEFYDDELGEIFDIMPRRPVEGEVFLASAAGNLMAVDSVVVRRTLLDEVGWFDEDRELSGSEDWELWTRCVGASHVIFVPGTGVRVHFHSSNSIGNLASYERALRCANSKILNHPRNRERLAAHRRKLRAGMWALLAHIQMLAGNGRAARVRLWDGCREDPKVLLEPVFASMALKAILGPELVAKGRAVRRRRHLRRQGYAAGGMAGRAD